MKSMEKCVPLDDGEVKCEEYFESALEDGMASPACVRDQIRSRGFRERVEEVLEAGVDQFMDVVQEAVCSDARVLGCTWSSVESALLDAAKQGLLPDGKELTLFVRGRLCTPVVLYEGAKKYLENHAGVEAIHADVVCANDTFEYYPGRIRRHGYRADGERGNAYAVYARAVTGEGSVRSAILARHEVDVDRDNSRIGHCQLWESAWADMAKVMALRSLAEDLNLPKKVLYWCRRLG